MDESRNNWNFHRHALDATLICPSPTEKNQDLWNICYQPYSEIAVLSPAWAPGVLDNPVVFTNGLISTVTNQENGMVGQLQGL